MDYSEFYSELGKLLYAVCDIDGAITKQEKERLKEVIAKELVPAEVHADGAGTDFAYYSEMEFDFLDENIADANAAFESFIDYVEEHHTAFDERMKKASLHAAKELAAAYRGVNRKEHALITKLKKRLEKIK